MNMCSSSVNIQVENNSKLAQILSFKVVNYHYEGKHMHKLLQNILQKSTMTLTIG